MFTQLNFQSFSEQVDHREQESTPGKEKETIILSFIVLPPQVIYQRQDSWDVHKPLLPTVEKFTSGRAHIQHMTDKYLKQI